MAQITIVKIYGEEDKRLKEILEESLSDYSYTVIENIEGLKKADLNNKKLLFAISTDNLGINVDFYETIKAIREEKNMLKGSTVGILIDGKSELFTKSMAKKIAFTINLSGGRLIGKSLVEGTSTLYNFNILAKNFGTDNQGAYLKSTKDLINRIIDFKLPEYKKPNLLVLHGSDSNKSNTIALWNMVKANLKDFNCKEISLYNENITDCNGCAYEICLKLGAQLKCFHKDIISEKIYPSILESDGIVLLCPNYNDSLNGKLTVFVNRLTALARNYRFDTKRLYSIIVSGYSGSDIVAKQLIGSLNMNKSFMLPPEFSLIATANEPNSINKVEKIEELAKEFGEKIREEFLGCQEF